MPGSRRTTLQCRVSDDGLIDVGQRGAGVAVRFRTQAAVSTLLGAG
jgi:hypothetical protein